jgi:hypothetical protein
MADSEHNQMAVNRRVLNRKLEAAGWGLFFIWMGIALFGHIGWGAEVFRPEIGGILGCSRIPFCCGWDLQVVQCPSWISANPVHCRRDRPSGLYICWQGKKFRITR